MCRYNGGELYLSLTPTHDPDSAAASVRTTLEAAAGESEDVSSLVQGTNMSPSPGRKPRVVSEVIIHR